MQTKPGLLKFSATYLEHFSIAVFCFFITSNFAIAATSPQNSLTIKLTLNDVIESALKSSPAMIISKGNLEVAELEAKNSFANFLPSIDLSASHGVKGKQPDTAREFSETPIVSGASLILTENFYDNGESAKKNRIANYKYQLAKINYENSRAKIIKNIVLAFYRNNIAIQNFSFTKKNYSELERLAKLVSNQFHQGMKTRKDYLSFTTKAQRGRLDVLRAEKDLQSARAELLSLTGLDQDSQIQFEETIRPTLPKKVLTFEFKPEDLFESKSLALQRLISEQEVALSKRKFWPEINLVGTASYGSSDYIDKQQTWQDNDLSQWSVLLNIKFNLLDWGVRSRNIQIVSASRMSLEQTERMQLFEAQKKLEDFRLALTRAEESYKISKELQKMEEDNFALLERDYKRGQTSYLELTTGLANLLDAQSRGLEADYQLAELYLTWKYYKGTLNEKTIFE